MLTLVTAWSLLASEPAPAQERPLAEIVTVSTDDPCLSPGMVEPVAAWLGRSTGPADLAVEVTATTDAVGFILRREGIARAERTLSPAPVECADRRAALGLAIAMALDAAVLESLEPLAPVKAEPTPVPAPEPALPANEDPGVTLVPRAPPVPAPEPAPAPLRLALAAQADASFGVLPRPSFGGLVALELGVAPWLDLRIAGGATAGLPTRLAGGEVTTALGFGGLGLCPGRTLGRVRVRLCAGMDAGRVHAHGRGFAQGRDVALPWVAFRTSGELDVWLGGRVALRFAASALAPLVRTQLDVRDEADDIVASRTPTFAAGQAGLGVVIRLLGPPPAPPPRAFE